jgi:cephalosporin hydroxylase
MILTIDTVARTATRDDGDGHRTVSLYSPEGFEWLSREWLRVGWALKYTYTFTWLGRPVIQLPSDMIRIQEVIYRTRPDVIIETGVAHGGSLVFYASLFEAMGGGRVIGVDVKIRPSNRQAIESHELAARIRLVEGDSVAAETLARVRSEVRAGESVMVVFDSCHSKQHVLNELESYGPLVTPGSYLVATDGIMGDLGDVPRGEPTWVRDNPSEAAAEFARTHPEFLLEQPPLAFDESEGLTRDVTHWPGAWLRRR